MNICRLRYNLLSYLFVFIMALVCACRQSPPAQTAETGHPRIKVSFKQVHNIPYTEVRRQYTNGLGFNQYGYHLEPEWRITFLSEDTVRIFSLVLQRFIHEPIVFDHDSVVSVAHSWLRVKKLSKDSIIFQVLYVKNQVVDSGSNIMMKLYSNDYIKNTLHTTAASLQTPPRRDTLFIKQKAAQAAADYRKAFAATEPVVLQSKTPQVTVSKQEVKKANDLANVTLADNYLSPTFNVTVHKAYADFDYYMQVIVDEKGVLHFVKPLTAAYDEAENRAKVMKGVVDGYLTYYLNITPGKTLGIPHASIILVRVKGITD